MILIFVLKFNSKFLCWFV